MWLLWWTEQPWLFQAKQLDVGKPCLIRRKVYLLQEDVGENNKRARLSKLQLLKAACPLHCLFLPAHSLQIPPWYFRINSSPILETHGMLLFFFVPVFFFFLIIYICLWATVGTLKRVWCVCVSVCHCIALLLLSWYKSLSWRKPYRCVFGAGTISLHLPQHCYIFHLCS